MRRDSTFGVWPKLPPKLTNAQMAANESSMLLWHKQVLQRRSGLYYFIERFNQGFVASLPHKVGSRTLEIGAGTGNHADYENLRDQQYYCLEYRADFVAELQKRFLSDHVLRGDIHQRQPWVDGTFDRIVAIHVLEHLVDLPRALAEIERLLAAEGLLDVVIPCEGGAIYELGRRFSSQRFFETRFKMDYRPIIRSEHVSTAPEILSLLRERFRVLIVRHFPLLLPLLDLNLCVGLRLQKAIAEHRPHAKV